MLEGYLRVHSTLAIGLAGDLIRAKKCSEIPHIYSNYRIHYRHLCNCNLPMAKLDHLKAALHSFEGNLKGQHNLY